MLRLRNLTILGLVYIGALNRILILVHTLTTECWGILNLLDGAFCMGVFEGVSCVFKLSGLFCNLHGDHSAVALRILPEAGLTRIRSSLNFHRPRDDIGFMDIRTLVVADSAIDR